MNVEFLGNRFLDVAQECEEFLVPMSLLALRQNMTRSDIERCEQRRCPVSDVAVSDALDVTQAHGKTRLRSIQGLDLALFIDTEDNGVIGWVEIEADDISDLLDEEWISGDLEVFLTMRLESKGLPDSLNRGLREFRFCRDRSARPVRTSFGLGPQRLA
jgi:hypothetical protein